MMLNYQKIILDKTTKYNNAIDIVETATNLDQVLFLTSTKIFKIKMFFNYLLII